MGLLSWLKGGGLPDDRKAPQAQIDLPQEPTKRVPTEQELADAAKYAIVVARSYVDCLPRRRDDLTGKRVLEFGPGPNVGSALVLAAWGAERVTVVDRFLPDVNTPVHRRFCEHLDREMRATGESFAPDVISSWQASPSAPHPLLRFFKQSLEQINPEEVGLHDITASNAVFEHLYHPRQAFERLFKVTGPGGCGLHQVDFRWHRNFNKPLEFLLSDEISFCAEMLSCDVDAGNRVRPHQMEALFRNAGFSKVVFRPNVMADDWYLTDFIPRLRACVESPYSTMDIDLLRPIGGRFYLQRE